MPLPRRNPPSEPPPDLLPSAASAANPVTGTGRRRLPPALRVEQILGAALCEFSARGYADTRMEDIARRAGLSKGGLYVHFASKDEVLEALLAGKLAPRPLDREAMLAGVASARELAERLVGHLHTNLADPAMVGTMRLLCAESARVPRLVERWRRAALDGMHAEIAGLLREAVRRGLCREGVALDHPWLLVSPFVHILLTAIVGGAPDEAELAQRRAAHVEMCCALFGGRAAGAALDPHQDMCA